MAMLQRRRSQVILVKVQDSVAKEYGFASWAELRVKVGRRRADAVPLNPSKAEMDLLIEFSTDKNPHAMGALLHHLIGTRDLLVEWGNRSETCAGGLFHSIYGTEDHKIQSASLGIRAEVASVIGQPAEELAFLFCVTARSDFTAQAGARATVLWDHVHGIHVPVTAETVDALIEIDVANFVEQVHPMLAKRSWIEGARKKLDIAAGHMSSDARTALSRLVERYVAQPTSLGATASRLLLRTRKSFGLQWGFLR